MRFSLQPVASLCRFAFAESLSHTCLRVTTTIHHHYTVAQLSTTILVTFSLISENAFLIISFGITLTFLLRDAMVGRHMLSSFVRLSVCLSVCRDKPALYQNG